MSIERNPTDIILHVIVNDGNLYPHFLAGRKLASLKDGTAVLVPDSAKLGDRVCFLSADVALPFILRPRRTTRSQATAIEPRIRAMFDTDDETEVRLKHFDLVGECVVEGGICKLGFEEEFLKRPWGREIAVLH